MLASNSLIRCRLPSNINVFKIKWVHGICEPTLIYLTKSDDKNGKTQYNLDVAHIILSAVGKFEFALRMR